MSGIIGKKIGMTSVFGAEGKYIPCTVILAGPCVVTQVKTKATDGYEAVQLSFDEKKYVNVIGTTKGKGFQGVVRRHHFSGVGGQTHGQHNRLRAPGSMGASSYPSRVLKGMRSAGHMGAVRVKIQNLQVVKIIPEQNLLVIKGAVPGHKGSYVIVEK